MRIKKTRTADSTFDINLAPFLDIIVSIVPLLLLSVVFVEIKMIETPIPQVVQNAIQKEDKDKNPEITLKLLVSKASGLTFQINERGNVSNVTVPNINGRFDTSALSSKASELKGRFPNVFKLGVSPDPDVAFSELVQIMDSVRKAEATTPKFALVDPATGQKVETDLMFPNVTFANVLPGE